MSINAGSADTSLFSAKRLPRATRRRSVLSAVRKIQRGSIHHLVPPVRVVRRLSHGSPEVEAEAPGCGEAVSLTLT